MSRLVILSDIEGNLTALEAVAALLPAGVGVIAAGDICLGGPQPAEVLDFIAERAWPMIMGNRDRDVVDPPAGISENKATLIRWTRERLGPHRLHLLAGLPFSLRRHEGTDSLLVVHANPLNLDDHLRPDMTPNELRPYLDAAHASILAFGHLHIPYVRPVEETLLIDVASVGHPKDRDRRAAYTCLAWDNGCRRVEQVRVPYDPEETIEAMKSAGMPGAERAAASLRKASY